MQHYNSLFVLRNTLHSSKQFYSIFWSSRRSSRSIASNRVQCERRKINFHEFVAHRSSRIAHRVQCARAISLVTLLPSATEGQKAFSGRISRIAWTRDQHGRGTRMTRLYRSLSLLRCIRVSDAMVCVHVQTYTIT